MPPCRPHFEKQEPRAKEMLLRDSPPKSCEANSLKCCVKSQTQVFGVRSPLVRMMSRPSSGSTYERRVESSVKACGDMRVLIQVAQMRRENYARLQLASFHFPLPVPDHSKLGACDRRLFRFLDTCLDTNYDTTTSALFD